MSIIIDNLEEAEKGEIYNIEKEILHYEKPHTWNVFEEGNMEREMEVDFHKFGVAVTEQTGMDLNKISTFTFYASVEHLKEKFKKRKNG